jgi:hypothetical protein
MHNRWLAAASRGVLLQMEAMTISEQEGEGS